MTHTDKTGIFALSCADRKEMTQHLLSLSGTDRYSRFFNQVRDEVLALRAGEMSLEGVYGCWIAGRLVALACVVPLEESAVEFAVSVDKDWRGRGLAKLLLDYGLNTARADKAQTLVIQHLRENSAMAAVAKDLPGTRHAQGPHMDILVDLAQMRHEQQVTYSALCGAESD